MLRSKIECAEKSSIHIDWHSSTLFIYVSFKTNSNLFSAPYIQYDLVAAAVRTHNIAFSERFIRRPFVYSVASSDSSNIVILVNKNTNKKETEADYFFEEQRTHNESIV